MTRIALAIDGLSRDWLPALCTLSPVLNSLVESRNCVSVETDGVSDPSAVWRQILSGKSWTETGFYGYGQPRGSLNEVVPMRWMPPVACINIPGTAEQNQFHSFPSYITASADIRGAASQIQSNTTGIAEAIYHFCQLHKTKNFIARFDALDLFSHLLGCDFLLAKNSPHWHHIEKTINVIDVCLERLLQTTNELTVVSAYGSQPCRTMWNLNRTLEAGGFCTPMRAGESPVIRRRLAVLEALQGTAAKHSRPDALMHAFKTAGTQAASCVAGAVYVNDRNRFSQGTVENAVRGKLIDTVYEFLAKRFKGANTEVSLRKRSPEWHKDAPDLVCTADGFDFGLYGRDEFDCVHLPQSIHSTTGFVLAEGNGDRNAVSATDLQAILMPGK